LGHFIYFLEKNKFHNNFGIDLVRENVISCKKNGFNVERGDLLNYLNYTKEKADVFVLSNVLEHFSYDEITKIIDSAHILLNRGGAIIIIVPNCNNIYGLATYFSDITHKSPLTEKSFEDLILKTKVKSYSFHNLIIYPNIPLVDNFIDLFSRFVFLMKKFESLFNGQRPYKVYSKNLLVVLKK
jgi:hypothetical protein